jgi:hypothetical protein
MTALNSSYLQGVWTQIWNNRYVQETNEMDWNCISVYVSYNKTNDIWSIKKNAILHNNKHLPIQKYYSYRLSQSELVPIDNKSLINPILDLKVTGPVSNQHYEYLVLTGQDNMTMFTWVRDIDIFNEKYMHTVSNLLIQYNYTGYYKSPLACYNNICL